MAATPFNLATTSSTLKRIAVGLTDESARFPYAARPAERLLTNARRTVIVRARSAATAAILEISPERSTAMESRAKLLGHPVHPMLIVLPLGLFIAAVIFDGLHLWRRSATFAAVAYWNIAAGVVGGLLAAVFGLIDWFAIPAGTRAKRIGLLHGGSNVVVVLIFAVVWLMRGERPDTAPTTTLFLLEVVALALGSVAGWLGGELVDRLGVGVDDGAHLNAPSSLSGRPAR
jgi:uncharacterized membrane protein